MSSKLVVIGLLVFSLALFLGCAKKHEHPVSKELTAGGEEHPAEGSEGEHPAEQSSKNGVTKEELAEAIVEYVEKESALKSGYFVVDDVEAGTTLSLKLDRVHKERLSRISEDVYFACADFKTPEGKVYDLDVFMKGTAKDNLIVTEVAVHKEEGKARYTWYEESGIWKKKHSGEKKPEASEGHEHPSEDSSEDSSEHPSEHPE